MTDNEKAATFIGWTGHFKETDNPDVRALNPVPDMSDPRNYMKALEAVVAADYWPQIEGSQLASNDYATIWKCRIGCDSWRKGRTPAKVIVQALAALYDAEHGSGAV